MLMVKDVTTIGGGPGPSGSSSGVTSPASKTSSLQVAMLGESQPSPPRNYRFQLKFAVTGQPVQGHNFAVRPGDSVTLSPINGTAVNAQGCSVGDRIAQLGTSGARFLPAASDVMMTWPCSNLNQIYASGTAGDGVLIEVLRAAVG